MVPKANAVRPFVRNELVAFVVEKAHPFRVEPRARNTEVVIFARPVRLLVEVPCGLLSRCMMALLAMHAGEA